MNKVRLVLNPNPQPIPSLGFRYDFGLLRARSKYYYND